ncbi:peptide-methionine (S)-S-oxide reductase MsrA [Mucilaginibacter puniceus]
MKKLILYIACALLFFSCANGQSKDDDAFATVPAPKAGQQLATFGGGCFWASAEAMSELKGVDKVIAGYAGGTTKNPTYEEVCTETTGHAEVVQVYYDPKVISYENLAKAFFYAHDPTQLNRQGPDEGTSYRSIAFYRTPQEKATLNNLIKEINASKHYNGKIVTQVVPFKAFYAAENYHQGYYKLHMDRGYIRSVSVPKVEKMRKAVKELLKPEFQKM